MKLPRRSRRSVRSAPWRAVGRPALVLASGALVLAACGGSGGSASGSGATTGSSSKGSSSSSSGKVVNVLWWNMWSGATLAITKKMVSEFNATHPTIKVTQLNVPSADGDAKLLSSIAAGNPPDVFTEWNATLGEYAYQHDIQPLNQFMTGTYAGMKSFLYPVAVKGGTFAGKLYGIPMSMNSEALYYNKIIMKQAGITHPPKTLAQLNADQAKEWKISGGRVTQIGFYPIVNGFAPFTSYFGDVKGFVNGKYDLAGNPKAVAEMKWLASYSKYPYAAVTALNSAYGAVGGGSEDPFDMGKQGFYLSGPWEGYENIPPDNPGLVGHFGVESFPPVPGGTSIPSTWVNGNYNIIPKGAKHPRAAFTFISWLAGYNNVSGIAKILPMGGWVPPSPKVAATSTYQAWLSKNPYLKPFITQFGSSATRTTTLTPAEAQYNTALGNAVQYVATKKMTPVQALTYVDTQANKALPK